MKIFICILLLLQVFRAPCQVFEKAEDAFERSKTLQYPLLVVFSGSDWCVPCIRFQNTILNDEGFQKFASKQIIILKADFPQQKKLPKELVAQNEELAENIIRMVDFRNWCWFDPTAPWFRP